MPSARRAVRDREDEQLHRHDGRVVDQRDRRQRDGQRRAARALAGGAFDAAREHDPARGWRLGIDLRRQRVNNIELYPCHYAFADSRILRADCEIQHSKEASG